MSFKLALLFVVCFLALAGAIPVERTEDEDTKQPQPVAADPEKEATEEDTVPEGNEDEDENEDQSQEDPNDEEKEDEEDPEADDNEEEPENELEARDQEDENDEVKRGRRRPHRRCKWLKKRVRRCRYKLRCTGNYYRGHGRCCRKHHYCRYYWKKRWICQICRRKCKRLCSYRYRKACQPRRVCRWRHRRLGNYQYSKYRYCHYVKRCRKIRYHFCRHHCYYRCYFPRYG